MADQQYHPDIEIEDVENYRSYGEKVYNAQTLCMEQMKKCLENGSVEMVEGYWDEKYDKNGNLSRVYHPDTRKIFIESVKTLMMFVHRDYKEDKACSDKIESLKNKIVERKAYWLFQEWNWWCNLSPLQKQQATANGKYVNKGMFNKKNEFDNFFFDEEIAIYRELFATISDFIKDKMDDYEAVRYKG